MAKPISDLALAHCQAGNRDALRDFYHSISGLVLGVATSILGDKAQAEDVLHDVYLKALSRLGQWKGEGNINSWIYRMTVNECLSIKRKWKRFLGVQSKVESISKRSEDPRGPNQVMASEFLRQLPARTRAIIVLKYVEDLSFEEVAQIMEIPVGTAKSIASRAIKQGAKRYES
jgi:RNA polymerase sigma-70 factor (ECF subfamily)